MSAFSTQAQTVITGRILSSGGGTVEHASAHIVDNSTSFPRPILQSFLADASGRFEARLDHGGVHRFWFTGRFHDRYEFPIYIETGDSVDVDVFLGKLPYSASQDTLGLYLGITIDGELTTSRSTVHSQNGNGIFEVALPLNAERIDYSLRLNQLLVPTWGHGQVADEWVVNREGRIDSILKPKETGVKRLTININDFGYERTEPYYELKHAPSRTLTFSEIERDFGRREHKAREYLATARGKDKRHYEVEYDWSKDIRELERLLKREKDPFAKQVRYLIRMRAGLSDDWLDYKLDKNFAREVLDSIEPTSPLWSYFPSFFSLTMRDANQIDKRLGDSSKDYLEIQMESEEYADYVHTISHDHVDESSRATFLATAISWAYKNKQFERFEEYYKEYMQAYGDTQAAERIQETYRPNKAISVGKMIPDFSVSSLDDQDEIISRDGLLGTTYLLNFWATWCGPCITKMGPLHKIQASYKDQDFTVLGISINFTRDEALEFRKRSEWKMPWLNGHVDDWEAKTGILKDLEVVAIPKTILVGPDGIIIAIDTGDDSLYDELIATMKQ